LRDDFVQEEIRLSQASGSSTGQQIMDEEALALTGKGKGKSKKKGGKKKIDVSKVKCFIGHKQGHFASQCPEKKKNKPQMAASAGVEEFSKSFEEDFCLIAYMEKSTASSVWYIDSGASCHMTGHKEFFTSLQEGGVSLHIELGDDARYQAQGVGTVSFQRELGKPLRLADVLYVPGLTKNNFCQILKTVFMFRSTVERCTSGPGG
jgi:hypothetical protein